MIKSFANNTAKDVFNGKNTKKARVLPNELHERARRVLDQLNAAPTVDVLRVPPGNRLEQLRGDKEGKWSVRINDQWRVMFNWDDNSAANVEILDYH